MYQDYYYKTNAFYLTAFLLSKDIALEDIEKPIPNKIIFIFHNSNELQELVRIFNFGEENNPALQVNFKKAEAAIKKLKALIHD